MNLNTRLRIVIIATAAATIAGCSHDQGYDIGARADDPILPALMAQDSTDLSPDQFLQLMDRTSWPRVSIGVPRATTMHGSSYVHEARFEREGQPWDEHPTLASARHAEPGRGDDTRALTGELLQGAADLVLMPFRMIIGPHPDEAHFGPDAHWSLLPTRTSFDPGWFQPMGTAESPHATPADD